MPIAEETFSQARRALSRRVAAELVKCMAETDSDFAFMAVRLGKDEQWVRAHLYGLIDGQSRSLDVVSDLALAMGATWAVSVQAYEPPRPVDEPA